jgi:ABC-type multidrug transport system fused ATPase/permease subunit
MTGKIFPESSNIYQDQAKILFNYYSQAAEKIVQEEERVEKEIAVLEEEKTARIKDIAGLWVWFLTIILFFVYFIKKSSLQKQIDELGTRIDEYKKQHAEIFRDYKVNKLGVAYVPVADQIKYEEKSFVVDYTGKVPESEITLQLSRQNDLLIDTISDLENLSNEAPIVETSNDTEPIDTNEYSRSMQQINQHDYFGKLDRSLRTISYCMDDLDTTSVSLPLVADGSEYLKFLNEFATNEAPKNAPVIKVFDKEKYASSISKFQELNKLKDSLSNKTAQFEDVLKSLMMTMANSVQAISALKVASTDKVIFESNKILYQILKSPYNHYSPVLEYEEIERIRNESFDYSESVQDYEPFQLKASSRVKYNLLSGTWTAEDGSTTNFPFGVHQIYEEIVAPVVQNLMNENRIERLKIYNHIKDQKISYLNKWHQDTDSFYRANRAESADIINLMQESLREYVAAYNTLVSFQKTEDSMVLSQGALDSAMVEAVDNSAETLAAFELQSKEFQNVQNNFEEYMERLKEDIDLKAKRFGHIEYYDAKLRDGYSNEAAVAAKEIHELDDRRKPLATVNPLFAKVSELPPTPDVEKITFEHISLNLPVIAKKALEELNAKEDEAPQPEIVDEALKNDNTNIVEQHIENQETQNSEEATEVEKTEEEKSGDTGEEPYIFDEDEVNDEDE